VSEILDERYGMKLLGELPVERCECRCVMPDPVPKPAVPELLVAFGVLLIAAGAFGFAVGRIKRIRSRLKLT